MTVRLKHHNGTYYRRFVVGFGPIFGATRDEAVEFADVVEASRELGRHWAMGDCDVEVDEQETK